MNVTKKPFKNRSNKLINVKKKNLIQKLKVLLKIKKIKNRINTQKKLSISIRKLKKGNLKKKNIQVTNLLKTGRKRPQVLNIKEKGKKKKKIKKMNTKRLLCFRTKAMALSYLMRTVKPKQKSEEIGIKNIKLPLKYKVKLTSKRKVLNDIFTNLRINRLNILNLSYKLKNRALNKNLLFVSYKKKIQRKYKATLLRKLVQIRNIQRELSRKTTDLYIVKKRIVELNKKNELTKKEKKRKQKKIKKILQKIKSRSVTLQINQKAYRFLQQKYLVLQSQQLSAFQTYLYVKESQRLYWKNQNEKKEKQKLKKLYTLYRRFGLKGRSKVKRKRYQRSRERVRKKLRKTKKIKIKIKVKNKSKKEKSKILKEVRKKLKGKLLKKIKAKLKRIRRRRKKVISKGIKIFLKRKYKRNNLENIINIYSKPYKYMYNKIIKEYKTMKEYLSVSSLRHEFTNKRAKRKKLEEQKRGLEKNKKNVKIEIVKNFLRIILKKEEEKEDKNKELITKLLLHIIRGKGGEQAQVVELTKAYLYSRGMNAVLEQQEKAMEYITENKNMRLINEFLPYKGFEKVLYTNLKLLQKHVAYHNEVNKKPQKRVAKHIFKQYKDKVYAKKRDYYKLAIKRYRQYGAQSRNRYNIINNIIADEKKIYNLKLPKQRVYVPTLLYIYEKMRAATKKRGKRKKFRRYNRRNDPSRSRKIYSKVQYLKRQAIREAKAEARARYYGNRIPKKTKVIKKRKKRKISKKELKQGVLKIKLKRRNMFLVYQDLRTNKVDAVLSARQEYYRIYNSKEPEAQKKIGLKETALKPKGPIGRYISTEIFRRRVITQALINLHLTNKINYNILDMEIKKRGKQPIIKTILYKDWYVYKKKGLLRMYKFTKNKAHGRMRKKKKRRI